MTEAVIVAAARTPVGKRNGGLSGVHPVDLSAQVLSELAERSGIEPSAVDDVIWGCVGQAGEQAGNIARSAVLAAGWPEAVPGTTVDRQCGSSQQAIHFAAASVLAGHAEIVIAGGVESMTRVPMGSTKCNGPGSPVSPALAARYDGYDVHQGRGAEMLVDDFGLSRRWLDEYSVSSHERAAHAIAEGRFRDEIVPVALPDGTVAETDEGVRPGSSVAQLAELKPAFAEDGRITAGNSSQISDAAAGVVVMTAGRARELGITPLARVHTCVATGSDPVRMLTGPIGATELALKRSGLTLADIGAFEVNEAFASVVGAWLSATSADPERVNPSGGAIALGHPLGGSGARLATTLLGRLRQDGLRYGLQTMCEAGGMANATIFENWARRD